MSFSLGERQVAQIYDRHIQLLIKKLQEKNRVNPNHVNDMTKLHELLNYANKTAINVNKLDLIVRDPKVKKEFLKNNEKHNLDSESIEDFWFNLTVLAVLRYYWLIESSLGILLKGIKYGAKPKEKVTGSENLGQFRTILEKFGVNKHVDWVTIDKNFRNALAHGWFKRDGEKLVYFKNSKLEDPKTLTKIQLIKKSRAIYVNTMAIAGNIGNWKELKDLGESDPLR